jgi:TonB family protein
MIPLNVTPPTAASASEVAAPAPEMPATSSNYGLGLLKLAALEAERNRSGEAEAFYARAAQVLGERAEAAPAWMFLGHSMLRRKQHAEAAASFQKAQKLDRGQTAMARMWIGVVRERQQEYAEAESMYRSALAASRPGSDEAATIGRMYGLFLSRQGRADEAQPAFARQRSLPVTPSPGVLRVGAGVKPPKLLFKKEPQYSEEARTAKLDGTVVLYIEVGSDGWAHNVHVIRSLGLGLDEKAVEAVKQWRFQPGTKDGLAVPVAANVEVNFRLL